MIKLYKNIDDQLHYWETWDKDSKTGIIHWGIIGDKGNEKHVKSGFFSNFKKEIQKEIDKKVSDGYVHFDDMGQFTLLIEYTVEGMGSPEDIEKRTRLQDRMNETLGWTGLGHCDGGSIGSGTMEVCCFVVDFEVAKKIISGDLNNTEFSNYTRVFDENHSSI